jgi:hypothetical protein
MDSAQFRVAAKRSKAGDSRAKVIKVQQHFSPRTLALLLREERKGYVKKVIRRHIVTAIFYQPNMMKPCKKINL